MRRRYRSLRTALLALRGALERLFGVREWQAMLLWAILVGVAGSLVTVAFRRGLAWLDEGVLGRSGGMVAIAYTLPDWARVLVPAAGGLVAGLLLVRAGRLTTRKAASEYMEAIVLGNGRIPPAQTLLRSASSMVSIASGGSIGREGSMVQLSALCASLLGRVFRHPQSRLRMLVACGASAGLTAAYNAPIAGAFFVAEVVLGSIAMESLGPIIVAAVAANITMHALPGYRPVYEMPPFPAVFGSEVLLFGLLGALLGVASAVFLKALAASRRAFARLPWALPWRLALGGLVVGVLSLRVPEVWGNGYSVVNHVLHDPWPWTLVALVLAAKFAATLATAGSGAVGGVFTPVLFFGCTVGSLFGRAAQALWPHAVSAPFAYAIVGMGALLAGTTQAPLTAILMVFEMTLSHEVMLPMMAATVVAYFVARTLHAGSMYDITERRREQHDERQRLRLQRVRELVQPTDTIVGPDAGREEMASLFLQHPVKYLYVTAAGGRYLGVVPLAALNAADPAKEVRAADLVCQAIRPVTADMSLGEALQRFLEHRGERLPVIEGTGQPILLGVVSKSLLLQIYVQLAG